MNLMQRQSLHQWTSPSSLSYSPLSEQRHVLPVANDQEYDQSATGHKDKKSVWTTRYITKLMLTCLKGAQRCVKETSIKR